MKFPYRWGIVGYPDQGHTQGSDITHIQHGYPEARGDLWLQGDWSERLRLRLPEFTFSLHIWWAFWWKLFWDLIWFRNKSISFLSILISSVLFSPKSRSFLWGVVVPGCGGLGGAHLHPAASFHPHHPRTEQEVRQEVRIRWVHLVVLKLLSHSSWTGLEDRKYDSYLLGVSPECWVVNQRKMFGATGDAESIS